MLDPAEESALEADEPAPAADDEADPAAPPKMVVEPRVVSKVELPEVAVETMAEVVIAEDESDPEPAPPAPKIVVEPRTVERVESPEVT